MVSRVLVVRLFEFLQQHGQLINIGDGAHIRAFFVADFKRRGVVVDGDFLVAIGVFLRDEGATRGAAREVRDREFEKRTDVAVPVQRCFSDGR